MSLIVSFLFPFRSVVLELLVLLAPPPALDEHLSTGVFEQLFERVLTASHASGALASLLRVGGRVKLCCS
jgi:hypothetical protein